MSYLLCFKEDHASIANTIYKLFKGELSRDMDSSDFVNATDLSVLHMKFIVLQSARLAFHYCVEAFIMGEFDVPSHDVLDVCF